MRGEREGKEEEEEKEKEEIEEGDSLAHLKSENNDRGIKGQLVFNLIKTCSW